MVRSFPFPFPAILQEKGQLGSYLQEPPIDARSRIERHLAVRENTIQEPPIRPQRAMVTARKMAMSHETASLDTVAHLRCVIEKSLFTYTALQVKYSLSPIEDRTQSLSLRIRSYSTHEPFVDKSHNWVHGPRPSSSEGPTAGAPSDDKLKVPDVQVGAPRGFPKTESNPNGGSWRLAHLDRTGGLRQNGMATFGSRRPRYPIPYNAPPSRQLSPHQVRVVLSQVGKTPPSRQRPSNQCFPLLVQICLSLQYILTTPQDNHPLHPFQP